MKKWLSVLELHAAMRFKRVLLVLGTMIVLQMLSFWILGDQSNTQTFFQVLGKVKYGWIFALGFLAMYWALSWPLGRNETYSYTLQRLSVTERGSVWMKFIFNALCFVLLVIVQAGLILLMAKIFEAGKPFAGNAHGILIDLEKDGMLHALVSFSNPAQVIYRIVYILIATACATHMEVLFARKQTPILSFIPPVILLLINNIWYDEFHVAFAAAIIISVICMITALVRCRGKKPCLCGEKDRTE